MLYDCNNNWYIDKNSSNREDLGSNNYTSMIEEMLIVGVEKKL